MDHAPTTSDVQFGAGLRKGALTRKRLLAAARTVFAREGYLSADISQITREAGKSSGVFYNYFDNKADLLLNLIEDFRSDLQGKAIPAPVNAPENARAVLRGLWDTYKAHAATFLAITDASTSDPVFARAHQSFRNFARADFEGMVRARQAKGQCGGLDPCFTAMALETTITYCLYEWLAQGLGAFKYEDEERRAFETLAGLMDAVLLSGEA